MNVSKRLCLVLASTLVVFSGCLKKPVRPTPDQTMGTGGGQSGFGLAGDSPFDATTKDALQERKGIDDGKTIRGLLDAVYFDFDKSNIKESERPKLQAAKEYLDQNPQHRILFEGHCDWRGTAEYNLGLGDRRANAAKNYLVTLGVPADKIVVNSKGSLDAKEKGTSDEMAKDRRAETVVVKE